MSKDSAEITRLLCEPPEWLKVEHYELMRGVDLTGLQLIAGAFCAGAKLGTAGPFGLLMMQSLFDMNLGHEERLRSFLGRLMSAPEFDQDKARFFDELAGGDL